jgi:hypothetical protein
MYHNVKYKISKEVENLKSKRINTLTMIGTPIWILISPGSETSSNSFLIFDFSLKIQTMLRTLRLITSSPFKKVKHTTISVCIPKYCTTHHTAVVPSTQFKSIALRNCSKSKKEDIVSPTASDVVKFDSKHENIHIFIFLERK